MSNTIKVCQVISEAIANSPALSMLDSGAIFVGLPPAGVDSCVTVDGVFSIEAKQKQNGITIHLYRPFTTPDKAGDIHDIADALIDALKGSAILTTNWVHQPDATNNIDHVVFPATVYIGLL
jgi:hypothetical protein